MTERVEPSGYRRWSLRLRVGIAIVFAALAPLFIVFLWSQLDRQVPGRMQGEAWRAAASAVVILERGGSPAELSRLARELKVRLRVLDTEGRVVFDEDADDPDDRFGRWEGALLGGSTSTLHELDDTLGPLSDRTSIAGARGRGSFVACDTLPLLYCEVALKAPIAGGIGGDRVVHAERSSRRAVQAVYALRAQLIRLAIFTVPIALIVAIYTGRRVLRPVEHLRRQALERAATASPSAMLDPERRDEVGALAEAFNALLDALERRRQENSAFVADLVHELKNPVAAVRAASEALARGGVDEERAARLARVLSDSSSKLDGLVSQFLELARAEAGMPNEAREDMALAALARGLVQRMKDDPRFPRVTFDLMVAGDPHVVGVPHRLDALLRELLENGASFADQEGRGGRVDVRVDVSPDGHEAVVAVHDSGPGIAEADLPRVFDRFFTTRGGRRGTGLGLALVQAVARAHNGRVEASSTRGATFTLTLPLARPSSGA